MQQELKRPRVSTVLAKTPRHCLLQPQAEQEVELQAEQEVELEAEHEVELEAEQEVGLEAKREAWLASLPMLGQL